MESQIKTLAVNQTEPEFMVKCLTVVRNLFKDGSISTSERDKLKEMIFDDDQSLLKLFEDLTLLDATEHSNIGKFLDLLKA